MLPKMQLKEDAIVKSLLAKKNIANAGLLAWVAMNFANVKIVKIGNMVKKTKILAPITKKI